MTASQLPQFRAIFHEASDAMLVLDDCRRILEANPAACSLFGVELDRIVQLSLEDLVADRVETIRASWHELLEVGEAKREQRVRTAGGTRLIEFSYRARVHGDRHLLVARDVTDRRLLEERLAQSEKIECIGRFAGGIAHDFNNLLTAILGYTELLLSSRGPNDPDRADLEEIQRAGQRAAALTQRLLAFSRKQLLMPKEVDLNQTIASLQGMLTRLIREDIDLVSDLASTPAVVRIDPVQLEQVILNLVLNARDALASGGEIRLEVRRVPRALAQLAAERGLGGTHGQLSMASEYVRLRVIDNGVGISPEARAHLFEPFYTTKEVGKGTGLGLASVYGIVRQSNGSITVDSEPGRGTTFTMYFPAVHQIAQSEGASARVIAPVASSRPPQTILLVEDEDAVRAIISATLKRQGYEVVEASTPSAACTLFDQHRSIDLLLTDVVMPEMNGPALAQRLIGQRSELRVLFISGYSEIAIPIGGENSNMSFLSKPFQASVLTSRVRQLLGGGEGLVHA